MISIEEAFRKFKSRLELTKAEQDNASDQHTEVREYLRTKFAIENDFLTGSYARYTKTKPLKDIDIFFVMKESEKKYRENAASVVLNDYRDALVDKYGETSVRKQSRSVNVDFSVAVDAEDDAKGKILSVDVVPAFVTGKNYEIPDGDTDKWILTNPKIHADRAVAAHQAYSNEWKGLVRMMKYWNNNPKYGCEKPIKPSFLIEVMALQCLHGGWGGQFEREFQTFFATLADRISETWKDPAGLGPPISNSMDVARVERAKTLLKAAERQVAIAIDLARKGKQGEALRAWRALFGPLFPLS